MKIYTRIVYGWQPDGSLKLEEADSFDYEGPVAQMKDAGGPPPAPDYNKAAYDTMESSRVNQYTPFGNLTWTPGTAPRAAVPDRLEWDEFGNSTTVAGTPYVPGTSATSRIELAPEAQRALDASMTTSADLAELARQQTERVGQQGDFDLNSVQDISDQAYAAQTRRLDPQWAQRASEEETKLRNQGLVPGGEAYDNAMRVFNQGRNDAYDTARLSAFGMMPTTYQLANSAYNQPLNYLNALRSGNQIQNPQFMSTPGANYLGGAQAQGQAAQQGYASEVAQAAAQNQMTAAMVQSLMKMMGSASMGA